MVLSSTDKQLLYTFFSSYFTLEDLTAPKQFILINNSFTFLCLKAIYTFTTPTNYPCVFPSLLSSLTLNAHPTSHTHSYTMHSPLVTIVHLLTIAPFRCTVDAPSRCTVVALSPARRCCVVSLLATMPSRCEVAAMSHCSNNLVQVLPLVASTYPSSLTMSHWNWNPWILYVLWTCVSDSSSWVFFLQ